ncbi:MAG: arginase [Gammaproteobacteria bacterium]|nr:arginase [Gammaproteobacteria bacterium]
MTTQKKPVHIIGVPLDLGASRRGTDAGPSAVRVAGLSKSLTKLGYEVTVESDIPVPTLETRKADSRKARFKNEILQVCTNLAEVTRDTLGAGEIPLVIGGDHSIAMGTVAGVAAHFRQQEADIGLIWFDAHGDMNLPETSPSGNIHGMPLAHLLGHGDAELANILGQCPAMKPENVVLLGIRDIDDNERQIIRDSGIKVFTMSDIDELGMTEVSRQTLEIVTANTAGFHISFDVDGCDPSVIPGSGTLVPGGVSFREAHQLLENCAKTGRMTSMEVVELNPFLDQANISAERAVALIQSAFGSSIL